ncbi:13237_t:CDS:2 [Cetraspora pellucida]|uniref:13237_t:CDS:1 n=1 Tax=Cetraspora pellucida TaxID=1433469 RepID=A0A9N9NE46_9GLOM|nr:13237_t:CDS:2 [Cetraspora pellucida]
MPKDKKVKVSKKNSPPKKRITNACEIGWCDDEEKLNICEAKRPPLSQVVRIDYGPITQKNRTYYLGPLYKRFFAIRLFQTDFEPFANFYLQDISVYLEIEDITQIFQIPVREENSNITPLISTMTIRTSDILLKNDFQEITFNKKVKYLLKHELEIDCNLCPFTRNKIVMCLDLNFINFIFYFKKKTVNDEFTTYILGEGYDFNTGNSGISSYIGNGYIKSAWSPHITGKELNSMLTTVRDCYDKEEE